MAETSFGAKNIGSFLLYLAIGALCIAAIVYMLLNTRPEVNPKVEHPQGPSMLVLPPGLETTPADS
jgi:uncharacterized membrane protein YfcA